MEELEQLALDAWTQAAAPIPPPPVLDLGVACALGALSAPLCALSLALLRLSAISYHAGRGRRRRTRGMILSPSSSPTGPPRNDSTEWPPSPLLGLFGAVFLLLGLGIGCLPTVMGAKSYGGLREAGFQIKLARMLQCTQVLFCWILERYLVSREPLPTLQGVVCVVTWAASTIVEWAGPLPADDLSQVLFRQKAGCDGGFRALFSFFYVPLWTTALVFGVLMMLFVRGSYVTDDASMEDGDEEEDATDSASHIPLRAGEDTPRTAFTPGDEPTSRVFCRVVMPFLSGFAASGAGLVFATAHGTRDCKEGCYLDAPQSLDDLVFTTAALLRDSKVWFLLGVVMLMVAVGCAFHWTFRLQLSLGSWGPLSQCAALQLQLLQGHLLYRNYRWDHSNPLYLPFEVIGLSELWPYLVCFAVLVGVVLLYWLTAEWSEWTKSSAEELAQRETAPNFSKVLARQCSGEDSMKPTADQISTLKWLAVLAVFVSSVVFYIEAVTMPLYHYHLCAPEVQWLSGDTAISDFAKKPVRSDESSCKSNNLGVLEQINWYYENQMPFTAMLAAYSSVVGPPLEFCALGIALWSPAEVPPLILGALREWLSSAATTKFATPILYMLGVTLIHYADPGVHSFRAQFTRGFTFMMLYCFTLGVLVKMLEPASKSSRELPTQANNEGNEDSPSDGEKSMELSGSDSSRSDEDNDCCGDRDWCQTEKLGVGWLIAVFCCLMVLVGVATYYGITTPLLVFDMRYSDALVLQFDPTLLDLFYTLLQENVLLSCFAAATLVLTVPVRIVLIVLNRTVFHNPHKNDHHHVRESFCSCVVRRLERLAKQFSLGHVWAESILLVWFYVITRNKDEYQLCARMPMPPIGLVAIAALGIGLPSAGHLMDTFQMISSTAFSPGRRLGGLPGGSAVWGGGPFVMFVLCAYLLYSHGPPLTRELNDIADLNALLGDRIVKKVNEHIRMSMPESKGMCDELRDWTSSQNSGETHENCMGHGPLSTISKGGKQIVVKWATGLNALEVTNMTVMPPTKVAPDTHQWNLTMSGVFTNLKVWVQATAWRIDGYECCDKALSFTVQMYGNCTESKGFGQLNPEILYVDRPEIRGVIDSWNTRGSSGSLEVDFGNAEQVTHGSMKKQIQDYIVSEGKLMMKYGQRDAIDVFAYLQSNLNKMVQLNWPGQTCPPVPRVPTTATSTLPATTTEVPTTREAATLRTSEAAGFWTSQESTPWTPAAATSWTSEAAALPTFEASTLPTSEATTPRTSEATTLWTSATTTTSEASTLWTSEASTLQTSEASSARTSEAATLPTSEVAASPPTSDAATLQQSEARTLRPTSAATFRPSEEATFRAAGAATLIKA